MQEKQSRHIKTAIVTGATSGIGFYTALGLAEKKYRVIVASRNEQKTKNAARVLRKQTGNEQVYGMKLDLASFKSIRAFAGAFTREHASLDVLINNAGIFTSDFQLTEDGFEMQIGVNHFGHFLLTDLLRECLLRSDDPRLVVVSSLSHLNGKIDFDSFRESKMPYKGLRAYEQSKLANVLFTLEHARRFPKIAANCLHPGMVRTPIANKHSKWYVSLAWTLLKPIMITAKQGAKTSLFLATDPRIKGKSGGYYDDKQRKRNPAPLARDEELAKKLWEYSLKAALL